MEMCAPSVSNWSLGTKAGAFIFLPYVPGWVVGGMAVGRGTDASTLKTGLPFTRLPLSLKVCSSMPREPALYTPIIRGRELTYELHSHR